MFEDISSHLRFSSLIFPLFYKQKQNKKKQKKKQKTKNKTKTKCSSVSLEQQQRDYKYMINGRQSGDKVLNSVVRTICSDTIINLPFLPK